MKTTVNIRLMENDFQLTCNSEEKYVLEASAEFLNTELKSFQKKQS